MVADLASACVWGTIVVNGLFEGRGTCAIVVGEGGGGVGTGAGAGALGEVFFKVGGCDEDGAAELADVDAAEGGVLFDVQP